MGRRKERRTFDPVEVIDIADKGKAIGRCIDGRIILVENAVPGDVISAEEVGKRKGMRIARAKDFHHYSEKRTEPFCQHFEHCGGCSWQDFQYQAQLEYKENSVRQNLIRLGGLVDPVILPILGAERTVEYRNKLEFTFTVKRWLPADQLESADKLPHRNGVGFHVPGSFAHVLDIEKCHLMREPVNKIRNGIRAYAIEHGISFQDIYRKTGLLRNLILRCNKAGEFMVILVFKEWQEKQIPPLLEFIQKTFPEVMSLFYCLNPKVNDSIADLPVEHVSGREWIEESIQGIQYRIGPKSFFQTNPEQASSLIGVVKEFADLKGEECVYDLYTGIGTIGLSLAPYCKQVVGIEELAPAIDDAKINAQINGLSNLHFLCGDVKDVLSDELVQRFGRPDLLLTDPPRAGMHKDAIAFLLKLRPRSIIYVSCNPSTQARDIALLGEGYRFVKARPVDMFPHTSHVENVAQLILKDD